MKILLINHYAGSLHHGMEYRPFYLAREWVHAGHQVTILAASFSHVRTHNPVLNHKDNREETIDGVRYLWLKTPPYQGNGVSRGINILVFIARLFLSSRKIIRDFSPDLIITSSTHPLDIFPAYYLTNKLNAILVHEVHDLWPLGLIEGRGMSPLHPFIILLQLAANFAYKNAHFVVSLLPMAANYMQAHGMHSAKFVHIPNGIDISEWGHNEPSLPGEHARAIANFRSNKNFLVGYAGAHGIPNALDSFIEAAPSLQDHKVGFVLIGHGSEKEDLVKKAQSAGMQNVLFLPSIPKSAISDFLSRMDALYIGLKSAPHYRFGVSPNKLIDYMMAAKPIIYAINAGNDMVADCDCGFSLPPEKPDAIVTAVKKLVIMSSVDRNEMGLRGREYVLTHHVYPVLARRFLENIV